MDAVMSIVILFVQLFLGVVLGIISVYLALRFFDRMTEGFDEIAELKKGNVAVAIVLLSLIVSIGTLVGKGVQYFEGVLSTPLSTEMFVVAFVMAVVQILVVLLIAVLSVYLAIRVLDTLTEGIDELKELKRGNVAVALVIAAVIYVIAFIISDSISSINNLWILKPETLASLLGVK